MDIECSVMSSKYLESRLTFMERRRPYIPHHENEIARARPQPQNVARYWMHNAYKYRNKKMSKSEGNFFTSGIIKDYSGQVIRFYAERPLTAAR